MVKRRLVARVDVRLADRVLVRHGHQGGHLGDQANGRDLTVLGVIDVGAVVVRKPTGHPTRPVMTAIG